MAGSFSDAELERHPYFWVGDPSGLLVALRFCLLIVSSSVLGGLLSGTESVESVPLTSDGAVAE
jgi:hypothetical protein